MKKIYIIILIIITLLPLNAQRSKDFYLNAMTMSAKGKPDSALLFFDAAITREPNNYLYYLRRGELLFSLEQYTDAIKDFDVVNNLKTGAANLWLAKSYASLNNDTLTIDYLKKHLQSDYRVQDKKIKTDKAFNRIQLSQEWFSLWQEEWYTEEELLEDDINYLLKKENHLEAMALIDDKLPGSKNPEPLYRYKAQIESASGNHRASAMDWTESLNIIKDNLYALKERGIAYLNAGRFKESADDFSKAIRIEPADFELYILRAKALSSLKDYNTAIKEVNLFLHYFPENEAALFLYGELNYENGNYVEALRFFNKNLRIDSSKPEYYKARGKAYYQTKMYKYAIDDLSMSLDLNPNDGEVYYYKGLSRYSAGDKTGACADWKIAARLGESKAVEQILKFCQ